MCPFPVLRSFPKARGSAGSPSRNEPWSQVQAPGVCSQSIRISCMHTAGFAREGSLRPVLKGNPLCSSCQGHKHAETALRSVSVFQGNSRRVCGAKVNVNSLAISRVSFINPFGKWFFLFLRSVWCSVCLGFWWSVKPLQKSNQSGSGGCWDLFPTLLVFPWDLLLGGKTMCRFPSLCGKCRRNKCLQYFWSEQSRYAQPTSWIMNFGQGETLCHQWKSNSTLFRLLPDNGPFKLFWESEVSNYLWDDQMQILYPGQ